MRIEKIKDFEVGKIYKFSCSTIRAGIVYRDVLCLKKFEDNFGITCLDLLFLTGSPCGKSYSGFNQDTLDFWMVEVHEDS